MVLPDFPVPNKSKYHKNYFPVGLLKIGAYYKGKGNQVKMVVGNIPSEKIKMEPTHIYITSFFTYWAVYVKDAVVYYKNLFPNAKVIVGGIYASLMPDHCKVYTGCHCVFKGQHHDADKCLPSYRLFYQATKQKIDYCVIHTTRGCIKSCHFCGAWKIEPEFTSKRSIRHEIPVGKRIVVFYDNNLLANPYIEDILGELIQLKQKRKILYCEAQCGLDKGILLKKPHLVTLLKQANFKNIKIAWDEDLSNSSVVKSTLDLFQEAGYNLRDVGVFMLYNHDLSFQTLEKKRKSCWDWGVQIVNCQYRPLDNATTTEIIHTQGNWSKAKIKQFRKNVRRQNICVRFRYPIYISDFERKRANMKEVRTIKNIKDLQAKITELDHLGYECWQPKHSWK